jgi:hypothetical protein
MLVKMKALEGLSMRLPFAKGKICYIEISATDMARSAEFYGQVFP